MDEINRLTNKKRLSFDHQVGRFRSTRLDPNRVWRGSLPPNRFGVDVFKLEYFFGVAERLAALTRCVGFGRTAAVGCLNITRSSINAGVILPESK